MIKLANASSANTMQERQVRICDYYDKGWTWIIRPPEYMKNGIAFVACKLCDNDLVCYSQEKRLTLDNFLKSVKYDINKINSILYCDCSSFVATCININGGKINTAEFTTRTMHSILVNKGFKSYKFSSTIKLEKGDILVKEGSHTVIVVSGEEQKNDIEVYGRVEINDINSYLNVREEPNTKSKVIKTLRYNDKVKILNQLDGWYNVSVGDVKGYCFSDYITLDK